MPPRIATLMLLDAAGRPLGALPPVEVDTPWWQEVAPVIDAVRRRDGIAVTVLRLVDAARPQPHGGAVTYLAQVDPGSGPLPALGPFVAALDDHPLRLPSARPGGPQADLAWAAAALAAHGTRLAGPPRQIRTWNLSSVWSLPTAEGPAWLKVVPPFFAHEGAMLEALHTAPVPRPIARDGARMLLAHLPGNDGYVCTAAEAAAMIDLLVDLQARWSDRIAELQAFGLPDWRLPALARDFAALLARRADAVPPGEHARLAAFADDLPRRAEALAACGLPEGLVHGDFHGGNFRLDGPRLALLDWGDSGIGHPLLDQAAFLDRQPAERRDALAAHWAAAWRRHRPSADPARAAALLAPVAAARQALVYQRFLDGIEPGEHRYHAADVGPWMRETVGRLDRDPA